MLEGGVAEGGGTHTANSIHEKYAKRNESGPQKG